MKRFYIPAVCAIFCFLNGELIAQIPNANFENWTIAENTTDSLFGWSSSNAVVISPVISLYKDTAAYEGNFGVDLVTAPFGFVGYSTVGVLANGEAKFTYGGGGGGDNVDYASGGGTPIDYKPEGIAGYYRTTTLAPGDLPYAQVLLSKYNEETNARDTVGYSTYTFATSEDFAPFSIVINDLMPEVTPDTVTCVFFSSNPYTVADIGVWSNLHLDSISLFGDIITGVEQTGLESKLDVYPNPATNSFAIALDPTRISKVDMFNCLGAKVASRSNIQEEILQLDVSNLPRGLYFIQTDNQAIPVKRIILE